MPGRGVSKILLALNIVGRGVSKSDRKTGFALITFPPRCQLEETIVAQLAKGCPAAGIIAEPMQVLPPHKFISYCYCYCDVSFFGIVTSIFSVIVASELFYGYCDARRKVGISMGQHIGSRGCKTSARSME